MTTRIWQVFTVGLAILMILASGFWIRYETRNNHLPFHVNFGGGDSTAVKQFGGTWTASDGIMRNSSDERGAKLIMGSDIWRDYVVDADIRILGDIGDAGVIVRSNAEEIGVDAYRGYYVGLRTLDNSIVIGSADFGWSEARPKRAPMKIKHLEWFHLRVVAVGCQVSAQASEIATGQSVAIAMIEPDCVRSGRIGLRSVSTGAEWKDVVVTEAQPAETTPFEKASGPPERAMYPRGEAEYNSLGSFDTYTSVNESKEPKDISTIESLRGASDSDVTVRGVVTLAQPALFVQDASAGIEVSGEPIGGAVLSLGDEVEATGRVHASQNGGLSVTKLSAATVRVLWRRAPAAPISVTALQATDEEFDGRLVEVQAEVKAAKVEGEKLLVELTSDTQTFLAVTPAQAADSTISAPSPHSIVRVRGICVRDPAYTHGNTPFVLLLRSTDDLQLIAGAPWWTTRNLVQSLLIACGILIAVQAYHARMQRQRHAAITGERERLAHELHDTLAQSFAGVAFQLQGIRNKARSRDRINFDAIETQLNVAAEFVRRTHQEASLSIARLKSSDSEVNNLAASLERSVRDLTSPGAAEVKVSGSANLQVVPLGTREAMFHIGREALVNAVRHSESDHIVITIKQDDKNLSMEVSDDGKGFVRDPECQRLGIKGIERRAAMIHADLRIESAPGNGTRVFVSVPLPKPGVLSRTRAWLAGRTTK